LKINLFSPSYSLQIAVLVLNYNHSLAHSIQYNNYLVLTLYQDLVEFKLVHLSNETVYVYDHNRH
jgi:hypothetical protein